MIILIPLLFVAIAVLLSHKTKDEYQQPHSCDWEVIMNKALKRFKRVNFYNIRFGKLKRFKRAITLSRVRVIKILTQQHIDAINRTDASDDEKQDGINKTIQNALIAINELH